MRLIHPAAWAGLLLNVALALMFYHGWENNQGSLAAPGFINYEELAAMEPFRDMGPDDLRAYVRQTQAELNDFMLGTVRPFHITVLLVQAAGLALIALKVPFALAIALVSGAITLPISLIYMIGCVLTYFQVKYDGFVPAGKGLGRAVVEFPAFAGKKVAVFAALNGVMFLVFLSLGDYVLGVVFLIFCMAGGYGVFRARGNPALSLYEEVFTLTPGLFTPRLVFPYRSVTLATLHGTETIQLDVTMPDAERSLVWSLRTVEPENRRAAVEEFGAALAANGVPLQ